MRIRFDEIEGFIKIYDGIKYLISKKKLYNRQY